MPFKRRRLQASIGADAPRLVYGPKQKLNLEGIRRVMSKPGPSVRAAVGLVFYLQTARGFEPTLVTRWFQAGASKIRYYVDPISPRIPRTSPA